MSRRIVTGFSASYNVLVCTECGRWTCDYVALPSKATGVMSAAEYGKRKDARPAAPKQPSKKAA